MGRGPGSDPRRRSGADDEGWSADERKLVDYLRFRGHNVQRLEVSGIHGRRSADAIVDGVVTEFKTLESNESRAANGRPPASVNSLISAAKRSKKQALSAVIDVRAVPLGEADVRKALGRLSSSPQIASKQIRYVGRDFDIGGDVS